MNTLAVVFCYQRSQILWHCANSLFENTEQLPEEVMFIDDGGTPEVAAVLGDIEQRHGDKTNLTFLTKRHHAGFAHSLQFAFQRTRAAAPDFLWLIESDYVFARGGLDAVRDVLENTEEGRNCFGICGYDHPDFYRPERWGGAYSAEAVEMLGTDPVNRAALWHPRSFAGKRKAYQGQLSSNTCISSYLNWRVVSACPEAQAALNLAADPQPIDGHPPSGQLAAARCPDDCMLSNGLNMAWSNWATERRLDRSRFACWLNIRPSVANHISGGGLHTTTEECATDAGSPSWSGVV